MTTGSDPPVRGGKPSLEDLIGRHLPRVQAYVRLNMGPMLREKESSADIVQSACRTILAGLNRLRFQSEGDFRYWFYKAAERKIAEHARYYRAQKRDVARDVPLAARSDQDTRVKGLEAYASVSTPSEEAMNQEQVVRIEEAFARLPGDYREVILLSRILGLSHAEIAAKLGRSPGAVRTLLSRARARLATLLDSREIPKS